MALQISVLSRARPDMLAGKPLLKKEEVTYSELRSGIIGVARIIDPEEDFPETRTTNRRFLRKYYFEVQP